MADGGAASYAQDCGQFAEGWGVAVEVAIVADGEYDVRLPRCQFHGPPRLLAVGGGRLVIDHVRECSQVVRRSVAL